MVCVVGLSLAPIATPAMAQVMTAPDLGGDCTGVRVGRPLIYRNPRFGLTMTYPASFTLDAESIPENGDSARLWSVDRRATAVVMAMTAKLNQSLAELLQEARQDVVENSHGVITYTRTRDDWFVISGYIGDRIFYRR